ncbi:hypothetical protein J4437_07440 [Candidatus Woesearchaeota archaeon]|nr:hypothetical protein [uncultured archaeon]MBS3124432.1 hypothetical protein [Candidatus Woesearchaeota archaeon]
MTKKCIICNNEASFQIKGTADYYCKECAEENFADLDLLVKVEEEALQLKEFVEQKEKENEDEALTIIEEDDEPQRN